MRILQITQKLFSLVIATKHEASLFIKNVITGLTLGDGSILLAVIWVQKQGQKYHLKFPAVIGLDVTFGTNAERRPLFRGSLKTSNNNNVPLINGYIPSEQRWVFEWLMEDALPGLLDTDALKKTRIIVSDQDAQLVGTLLSHLGEGGSAIYGNACNRLCKWHKVCFDSIRVQVISCLFLIQTLLYSCDLVG